MKPQLHTTTQVAVADLKPHPKNYREHPEDQLDHIANSIKQHGIYRNVVVAEDNIILAGHGVVKACRRMGIEKIPVIKLDITSDSMQALKLLAGDNEIGRLAEVDDRQLTDMLKEIKEFDPEGLIGTGYDGMMLANLAMVTRASHELKDINQAAEWVGMPDYEAKEDVLKLSISFRCQEDREQFCRVAGIPMGKNPTGTWATWWPEREDEDLRSVAYQ